MAGGCRATLCSDAARYWVLKGGAPLGSAWECASAWPVAVCCCVPSCSRAGHPIYRHASTHAQMTMRAGAPPGPLFLVAVQVDHYYPHGQVCLDGPLRTKVACSTPSCALFYFWHPSPQSAGPHAAQDRRVLRRILRNILVRVHLYNLYPPLARHAPRLVSYNGEPRFPLCRLHHTPLSLISS
eukprot:scaffold20994_cov124-Isochrysis_galbana.AAC.1